MGVVAVQAGLATVPTRTGDFADELEEIEMLISSNKQREKSPSQIAREGSELQRIEAVRADARKKATQFGNNSAVPLESKEPGESLDAVAASLGISRDRWYKIRTIFERAKSGDAEAVELMKALDAGDISVHKAYQTVKGQLDSEKGEKSRITKALEEAKKNLDEALQNPLTIFGESGVCYLLTNPRSPDDSSEMRRPILAPENSGARRKGCIADDTPLLLVRA